VYGGFAEKEIGLTEMQRKWYRSVLEKDIVAINGKYDYYIFEPRISAWL
jgi:hypothetical protein